MPPNGIKFHINDALYSSKLKKNLIFKYICRNGYLIEPMNKGNVEYFCITIPIMV